MATIKVRVQGEIATNLTPEVRLVCQNDKYDVEFEFDGSWANSNFKTALFIYNGQLIAIPFDGNICKIPALYDTELLHIGVKSDDVKGLHTTTPAKVVYLLSANDLTSNKISEPSKDVYDEIIALLNKYISGGGLTEEQVREIVAEETSDVQTKTDDNLETESKQVVGAINELNEKKVGLTDYATESKAGVVKPIVTFGVGVNAIGNPYIVCAGRDTIEGKTSAYLPIAANNIDHAVKVGLTTNTETLTSDEQLNAQKWLGVDDRFAVINLALEQSGLVKKYKQPIEQEYTERVTANGLNVLDGSKAVLKKVVGNTVACNNLLDTNIFVQGIYEDNAFTLGSLSDNRFRSFRMFLPAGTYKLCFSKEVLLARVIENDTHKSYGANLYSYTINTTGGYVGYSFRLLDSTPWDGSCLVWLTKGKTEIPYQPYFTGLKSASFAGIESTNPDGTETSTLVFPKTEMPLGTTIDFEAQKITDYGVTIELKGNEKIYYYKAVGINSIRALILPSFEKFANGVSTDFFVGKSFVEIGCICIGTAEGSNNMYIIGVLDAFGFTDTWADKSNPTSEEQATAVANFKAYLAQRYADGNPVTIRYVASTLQSETPFTAEQSASGNEYTAYKNGTEKVLDNDGAEYGADNTLTQDYILVAEVD